MKQLFALIVIFAAATLSLAEGPSQVPAPGAEQKRLGYFVGKWHSEGELKPGPFGPGGKYTEDQNAEWMSGGFFVVIHSDEKGPMGDGKSLMILGYDAAMKAYTFHLFDSSGGAESATGTFVDGAWTWLASLDMGGKQMKSRFIMKELSPTAYSTKFEMSEDGTNWMTIMEGKSTKVK